MFVIEYLTPQTVNSVRNTVITDIKIYDTFKENNSKLQQNYKYNKIHQWVFIVLLKIILVLENLGTFIFNFMILLKKN